uniref:CSON009565 protein n=1 Tax=Culicoides sonorensis TaxID=179676 RepID=A0A336KHH5_CULSO
MNVLTFSLLLPLIYIVNAQIEIPGACPANAVQSNFNISAYLGKWYEIKRYQTSFQQSGDCVTAQYALNSDNATISVVNQMTILPNKTAILSINGTGRLQSTEPPIDGRLFVNFFGNESDYWVLNTDYNNYAVVWSCANFGNNSMRM